MEPQRQPTRSSGGPLPARGIGPRKITIPLASRPRNYAPGSGPPLQPVSLIPASDSTAYIVERILLPSPGAAKDGKPLPKRMAYIVGWRDLPAARLLVPVMEILDYVSPYALEEWEFNMELELDQDRAMLEEEKRQLQQHPTKKAAKAKARPPVHSEIEAAAVAEAESDVKAKGRPKKGAMSLSTPQKTKMDAFADLSDDYDGYESPSEQLSREAASRAVGAERDMGGISEPEAYIKVERDSRVPMFRGWTAPPAKAATSSEPPIVRVQRDGKLRGTRLTAGQLFAKTKDDEMRPEASLLAVRASSAPTNEMVPVRRSASTTTSSATSSTHHNKELPSKQKQRRRKNTPQPADDGWEVERIEDSELYEVEGKGLVRYFKVVWAGDWPPEENPTWEPEENLPSKLVRNFLKTPKKKRKASVTLDATMNNATKKPKALVQSKLSWPLATAHNASSKVPSGGAGNPGADTDEEQSNFDDDDIPHSRSSEEDEESDEDLEDAPQPERLLKASDNQRPAQVNWSMENYGVRMAFSNFK